VRYGEPPLFFYSQLGPFGRALHAPPCLPVAVPERENLDYRVLCLINFCRKDTYFSP
jgi:hypothetical protein